jgi:hypothetical protein
MHRQPPPGHTHQRFRCVIPLRPARHRDALPDHSTLLNPIPATTMSPRPRMQALPVPRSADRSIETLTEPHSHERSPEPLGRWVTENGDSPVAAFQVDPSAGLGVEASPADGYVTVRSQPRIRDRAVFEHLFEYWIR